MAFLGHDHSPYDEEFIGQTTLVRMGSLTRIDTQEYNKDRDRLATEKGSTCPLPLLVFSIQRTDSNN